MTRERVQQRALTPQTPAKTQTSPVPGIAQAEPNALPGLRTPVIAADQITSLQRRVGNRSVQRLLLHHAQREAEAGEGEDKKVKPFTVSGSDERQVFTPKKPNGKTLYFFFGYTGSKKDIKMRNEEAPDVEDDVMGAAASGFTVIYDKGGTRAEFLSAIYDSTCYGIYWSGHGYPNGNIQSSDGSVIRPEDIDEKQRSPKITYLILAACNSGVAAKKWQKAVGPQCQFEGWNDVTNTSEAKDFTSSSFLDSWFSHGGTNADKELADYIDDARAAK